MNPDKYDQTINLTCPTCGCSDFAFDRGVDEKIEVMKCASCDREFSKDELLRENSENIDLHLSEIKEQITKDIADDFRKSLRNAFSGNKHIKIK